MTALVASEHQEQAAFITWFRAQFPGVLIFAIPNGAHLAGDAVRRAIKMQRMKAEGFVAGIPDLYCPAHQLWVEMKRAKGGRLSPDQEAMHEYLRQLGDIVIVAKGWDDAREQVRAELGEGGGFRSIGAIAADLVRKVQP